MPPPPHVEIDPSDGTPRLSLPAPFAQSHRLTLFNPITDVSSLHCSLSNPDVSRWLSRAPEPYTLSDAELFVETVKRPQLARFEGVDWTTEESVREHMQAEVPFSAIREVSTGRNVGDVRVRRNEWEYLDLPEQAQERHSLVRENNARPNGDPGIRSSIGYYLDAGAHHQGLMTAALSAHLALAREYLNLRHVEGVVRKDNPASKRVLEKNGLQLAREASMKWKDGTRKDMWILRRDFGPLETR